MSVKPLSPGQVAETKQIPHEVISTVNELLQEKFNGHSCWLGQDEVIDWALQKFKESGGATFNSRYEKVEVTRQMLFDRGWLNFEVLFRAHGWDVMYDKPGYNETYPANWKFTSR